MSPHTVPLTGCGLPRLRGVDTWARRELDDHTTALHRLLHGPGDPRTCAACGTKRAHQGGRR